MTKIKLYDCFNKWTECDGIWLYSDPHFGDEELKTAIEDRASDEVQIKNINSRVGKKGCLVILGDVGDIEYIRQIRGYKVLITGNHDVGASVYRDYFDEVYGGPLMISPKIILSHEPLDINWAFNIHGHNHVLDYDRPGHKCVCSDVVLYKPISLTEIIKSGRLKEITPLHRTTIDKATERKLNRK